MAMLNNQMVNPIELHWDSVKILACSFGTVVAFGTRVLKTRVPECAFWVDPFSNNPKLMYFMGLDTETFPPK